jgi:D-alanine-D-alanine ligase-like ATP-grasp enzyme
MTARSAGAVPVAVVLGGPSAEHDVSVVSGTAIAEALTA